MNGTEYALREGDGDDDGADAPRMDGLVDEYMYFRVCRQFSSGASVLWDGIGF
jgi:hypothetical protein